MRKLILLLAILSAPALAATAQQDKMKSCNAEAKAKGLKGDEYKKFRDNCLKATPTAAAPAAAPAAKAAATAPAPAAANAAPAPAATTAEGKKLTPQQEKMKKCSAQAKGLKGDEYKKVHDACLKG
jgi:hypothetical protein